MKKSVLQKRETIIGQSFALENYTIKEEISDDEDGQSQDSKSWAGRSKSDKSNVSAFASQPKTGEPLGKIEEDALEH